MACSYLYVLPVIVGLWFPLTFLITFLIAALKGHVNPILPYISDTSAYSPESCIFAQLVNMGLILLAFVIYIRYRQIRELYQNHNLPKQIQHLNVVSIIACAIAIFGVDIVANFQESNVTIVHLCGALIGFGVGVAYMILMTVISYKIFPMTGKHWIIHIRLILSIICAITFVICILFAMLAIQFFKGTTVAEVTKWSKKDGGWELHVVSTTSEWIHVMCMMGYLLTFTPEFRNISMSEPVLHIENRQLISDTATLT